MSGPKTNIWLPSGVTESSNSDEGFLVRRTSSRAEADLFALSSCCPPKEGIVQAKT